jgi:hypothetical protein
MTSWDLGRRGWIVSQLVSGSQSITRGSVGLYTSQKDGYSLTGLACEISWYSMSCDFIYFPICARLLLFFQVDIISLIARDFQIDVLPVIYSLLIVYK